MWMMWIFFWKVLVKKWRSQGIQILLYPHDGFACAKFSVGVMAITKKIKGVIKAGESLEDVYLFILAIKHSCYEC